MSITHAHKPVGSPAVARAFIPRSGTRVFDAAFRAFGQTGNRFRDREFSSQAVQADTGDSTMHNSAREARRLNDPVFGLAGFVVVIGMATG
ncbi:hypothetical protein GN330_09885 [Nitratireductor sp. CAU 1489]|uniref:Uncharacterized protein n=1 Tax=Nitratireductor arenosus TaxID=2682096 RepID=A0A844QG12_9HYPH|nr:hypothetical protein [Nitratireductor arenosus]MVA97554.1 hypothetical protein [Nitratireductor arenosus]